MGIFDRLGYNPSLTGNNVTQYSESVIKHMDTLPPLLKTWQQEDIANNDTGGYFRNPVANVTQNIWNTSNNIIAIPNISNVTSLGVILLSANTLSDLPANNFLAHTNRISGVATITPETAELPHYENATNVGKLLSYIVYQSDGVQNNAPLMGNFTSLFAEDDLNVYYQRIQTYPAVISNSINVTSDNGEIPTITYSSNLSSTVITAISSNLTSISAYMDTRRLADVNFYNNSQEVVRDYHDVKQFSNMGGTQTDMVNNFVGTDKLKSRINS